MSHSFEISVKINDQKFDICIEENKSVVEFTDIYAKLKQVVKIGANEDINFKTHSFEVLEKSNQGETNTIEIKAFNHQIRDQSLIAIKPKPNEIIQRSDQTNKSKRGKPSPALKRKKRQNYKKNLETKPELQMTKMRLKEKRNQRRLNKMLLKSKAAQADEQVNIEPGQPNPSDEEPFQRHYNTVQKLIEESRAAHRKALLLAKRYYAYTQMVQNPNLKGVEDVPTIDDDQAHQICLELFEENMRAKDDDTPYLLPENVKNLLNTLGVSLDNNVRGSQWMGCPSHINTYSTTKVIDYS